MVEEAASNRFESSPTDDSPPKDDCELCSLRGVASDFFRDDTWEDGSEVSVAAAGASARLLNQGNRNGTQSPTDVRGYS